jgi:hypothetical protein
MAARRAPLGRHLQRDDLQRPMAEHVPKPGSGRPGGSVAPSGSVGKPQSPPQRPALGVGRGRRPPLRRATSEPQTSRPPRRPRAWSRERRRVAAHGGGQAAAERALPAGRRGRWHRRAPSSMSASATSARRRIRAPPRLPGAARRGPPRWLAHAGLRRPSTRAPTRATLASTAISGAAEGLGRDAHWRCSGRRPGSACSASRSSRHLAAVALHDLARRALESQCALVVPQPLPQREHLVRRRAAPATPRPGSAAGSAAIRAPTRVACVCCSSVSATSTRSRAGVPPAPGEGSRVAIEPASSRSSHLGSVPATAPGPVLSCIPRMTPRRSPPPPMRMRPPCWFAVRAAPLAARRPAPRFKVYANPHERVRLPPHERTRGRQRLGGAGSGPAANRRGGLARPGRARSGPVGGGRADRPAPPHPRGAGRGLGTRGVRHRARRARAEPGPLPLRCARAHARAARLAATSARELAGALLDRRDLEPSPPRVVLTGVPARLVAGHGARAYRLLALEAGAAAQAAVVAATALGLTGCLGGRASTTPSSRGLLELDARLEPPLAVVLLGR